MSSSRRAPTRSGSSRGGAPRPTCDYGLDAAYKLALADWQSWVEREGEASALLDQVRAGRGLHRTERRPRRVTVAFASLRQVIGTGLIGAGRRVQGASATTPVVDEMPIDPASP